MRYVVSRDDFRATIDIIRKIGDRWYIKVISSSHSHSKTEGSISYNALVSYGCKIELDKEHKVHEILKNYELYKQERSRKQGFRPSAKTR